MLSIRYSESHRAYHTMAHISECLMEFDLSRHLALRPIEIEAALWFHDAVYDTARSDNEERSATLAFETLTRHKVSVPVANRVSDLVLVTKHDRQPNDGDTELIVDIDLSIFGQKQDIFDKYENRIRREYRYVPDEVFSSVRARILKKMLARDTIYHTGFFKKRYEKRARENLMRSIRHLEAN